MENRFDQDFWDTRYRENKTGWDIGEISTPLKEYIDQLDDKNIKILIPGAGNSYEAEYLYQKGFNNVYVIDVAESAIENFKKRVPGFPEDRIMHGDFFNLKGTFDLIFEQTFFCALEPSMRSNYVLKMSDLLEPKGKLVGLLFNDPLNAEHPPFGGSKIEYEECFGRSFQGSFEICYNSIEPRSQRELFIMLQKKNG